MKKKYFLIIYLFLQSMIGVSQVSSYIFQQTNSVYSPITGGTALGATANDEEFFVDPANLNGGATTNGGPGFSIGFNFDFNGVTFDRFGVNTNGWIALGQSSLSPSINMGGTTASNTYTPISSSSVITPTLLRNRIAGMAYDLQGQTGSSMRFQTTGTAPNRVLTVQWTNFKRWGSNGNGDSFSFQIKLFETSNQVSVVYGTITNTSTTQTSFQVGLGGQSNTDFNIRGTAPVNGNWNTSFAGSSNSVGCYINNGSTQPVSGLTFNWGATTPCAGTPSAGAVTPSSLSLCSGSLPGSLSVAGFSIFTTGLIHQWEQSNDNFVTAPINAVGGSGATTTTYTAPAFTGVDVYYRLKTTCSNSGLSSYSAVIPVRNFTGPTSQASAIAVNIPFTTATVNWTNGNGARRIVVISKSPIVAPTNNTANAITANTIYSGSGQQIVYDGTGTTLNITGLTLSEVYYVGVFEYNRCVNGAQYDYYYNNAVSAGNSIIFSTQPQNDFCFGPTALTPAGSFAAGSIVGTLLNATQSGNPVPSAPACQSLGVSDVWYTVVVPASGRLTIETQVNSVDSITDSILGVYSGADCFGLTQIACDDDSGPLGANDYMAVTTVSGRTPGETLFIGVWNYNIAPILTSRLFKIAAYDVSLVTETFDETNFLYYPNPIETVLNLSYDRNIDKVIFYNVLGQEVLFEEVNAIQSKIDVSNLTKGTYLVKVIVEDSYKILKLVKN